MTIKKFVLGAASVAMASVAINGASITPAFAQVRAAITQSVDEPGRNAFNLSGSNATLNPYFYTFPVPAGKRYVIDQYSGSCDIFVTTQMSQIQITSTVNGVTATSYAPAHIVQQNGNVGGAPVSRYAATGLGPIYADAGTDVTVFANAVAGTGYINMRNCNFSLQGHAVAL